MRIRRMEQDHESDRWLSRLSKHNATAAVHKGITYSNYPLSSHLLYGIAQVKKLSNIITLSTSVIKCILY